MAIKLTRALNQHDIREGFGTVRGEQIRGEGIWVLPGGEKTRDMKVAKEYARRMDALIRRNLARTNNSLI